MWVTRGTASRGLNEGDGELWACRTWVFFLLLLVAVGERWRLWFFFLIVQIWVWIWVWIWGDWKGYPGNHKRGTTGRGI